LNLRHILAAAVVALPVAAWAPDPGPGVGAQVPALHAVDALGKAATVQSISGPRGVVLVFFRSAKWCPFCQKQLLSLKEAQAPLEQRGYHLAAISYDPPAVQAAFAQQRQIGYQFLSDAGSVTIDAFGLRDPQYPADSYAYGVPHPTILVLSPQGVVQAKLTHEGYQERPSVTALLGAIDALPAQGKS
jgi:peroxiredoxin